MIHERLLLALGGLTALALLVAGGFAIAGITAGVTLGYAVWIRLTDGRWRMVAGYGVALAYYRGVEWIVPALGRSALDAELLAIDRWMLGETPSVWFEGLQTVALSELMSACYLSYHLYLHGALAWAIYRRDTRFYGGVFTAFALGMALYPLVPAMGPRRAWIELFDGPIVGGPITAFSAMAIGHGESHFDVFPSLHVLITLALLDLDWRFNRRRFAVAIAPACVLFVSTLYLRYHYAIDVLAAVLVWAVARWISSRCGDTLELE